MRGVLLLSLFGLAACASTTPSGDEEPVRSTPQGECDATPALDRIGEQATQRLGAELLSASGATTLRWAPPRTAVTMDFRPDRLTVRYDDEMVVTAISCG